MFSVTVDELLGQHTGGRRNLTSITHLIRERSLKQRSACTSAGTASATTIR